jgi:hypothetical protein
MRLAFPASLFVFENMKAQKSVHANSTRQLLLIVPVICSMALAGCSDMGGRAGTQATVNLTGAAVGTPQTGDNVTIGPATYNSETRSFDRPWPFGPESDL